MGDFIIHNPHSIWYKQTLGNFFTGRTYWNGKYEYLLDEILLDKKSVKCLITPSKDTFFKYKKSKFFIEKVKFKIWLRINNLSSKKFKCIKLNETNEDDTIVTHINPYFADLNDNMSYWEYNIDIFSKSKSKLLINLSHYGYNTNISSFLLNTISSKITFWSENDLINNSDYFNSNFTWYKKKILVIPFVPQKRFVEKKSISGVNKCLAIGTLTFPIIDDNFLIHYPDGILQPNRKLIFENKENLKDLLDSKISPISEKINIKSNKYSVSYLKKCLVLSLKVLFPRLNIICKDYDRGYFDFDMVEVFNQFKLFVCPEEIIGLPGIGFVEGMSCGNVLIGVSKYYQGFEMIPGKHYIEYDGSIKDLKFKIKYFIDRPKQLNEIKLNSIQFANKTFNSNKNYLKILNYEQL